MVKVKETVIFDQIFKFKPTISGQCPLSLNLANLCCKFFSNSEDSLLESSLTIFRPSLIIRIGFVLEKLVFLNNRKLSCFLEKIDRNHASLAKTFRRKVIEIYISDKFIFPTLTTESQ